MLGFHTLRATHGHKWGLRRGACGIAEIDEFLDLGLCSRSLFLVLPVTQLLQEELLRDWAGLTKAKELLQNQRFLFLITHGPTLQRSSMMILKAITKSSSYFRIQSSPFYIKNTLSMYPR